MKFFSILFLVWFHVPQVRCKFYSLSADERSKLINESYNHADLPIKENSPLTITTNVYVLNIRSIKESDLTLTVDLFVHYIWNDWRINLPKIKSDEVILLSSSYINKLWIPNVYFKNSIGGKLKGVLVPSIYFILNSYKDVLMVMRISLQLTCDMNFKNYPHDVQKCAIDIMSLSHTNETVILKWRNFKMTPNLSLTQYKVDSVDIEDCSRTYEIGSFSCIRGIFKLQRLMGHFILKIYIPSTLVVVMTFVGYWIPVSAHPARVALVITALLSLVTLQLHITSGIHTAYIVSINIWMLMCIGFVFTGFIEYAFAIAWIDKSSQAENQIKQEFWRESIDFKNSNFQPISDGPGKLNPIDLFSRKFFPILFITAIIIYVSFVNISQQN